MHDQEAYGEMQVKKKKKTLELKKLARQLYIR